MVQTGKFLQAGGWSKKVLAKKKKKKKKKERIVSGPAFSLGVRDLQGLYHADPSLVLIGNFRLPVLKVAFLGGVETN